MKDGPEAPRRGGVSAKPRGDKPTGGAKRPDTKTVRVQLHLGATTVERLGVHAALSHKDKSKIVETVLARWLESNGMGWEVFAHIEPARMEPEAEAPTME